MFLHALALVLASAPAADATLSVKVVSLDFSYPYFGEPGNTCQRGNVYVRAMADAKPVVVRMVDSAGLTPGSEAVLADVRRAGTGRDGTAVYCAGGRRAAASGSAASGSVASGSAASGSAASGSAASGSAASDSAASDSAATGSAAPGATTARSTTAPPPLVQAQPASSAGTPPPTPAPEPSGERCVARRFDIIKKPLAEKKFGPSEFDAESASGEPEVVDCSLARSRVTNVLLVRMVKDGFSTPTAVVGAEWSPGSTWQKTPDAPQRRAVTVYLVESR